MNISNNMAPGLDLPEGQECVPGVAPGSWQIDHLPARAYHAELERASCSQLKQMLTSPGHYMQQFFGRRPSSPAMQFGTLIHLLVLEPHRFPQHYAVVPGCARPSAAERRQAQELHPGCEVLSEVELHEARLAAERVMERQVRGRPFFKYLEEGLREVTFFYQDPVTAQPCRARLDLWHPDAIFDLKTTRHALMSDFLQACVSLHYDLQAYMYCLADAQFHGREVSRDFIFLALQNEAPHPVHVVTAGSSFMTNGEAKYVRAVSLLRACTDADHWPDNSGEAIAEIAPWQAFEATPLACETGARQARAAA